MIDKIFEDYSLIWECLVLTALGWAELRSGPPFALLCGTVIIMGRNGNVIRNVSLIRNYVLRISVLIDYV